MHDLKDLIKKYCIILLLGVIFDFLLVGYLIAYLTDIIKDNFQLNYIDMLILQLSNYVLYSVYSIIVMILIKRDSEKTNSYMWSIIAVTFFNRGFGIGMFLLYTAYIKLREENQSPAISK
jgi:hypothetical protein